MNSSIYHINCCPCDDEGGEQLHPEVFLSLSVAVLPRRVARLSAIPVRTQWAFYIWVNGANGGSGKRRLRLWLVRRDTFFGFQRCSRRSGGRTRLFVAGIAVVPGDTGYALNVLKKKKK